MPDTTQDSTRRTTAADRRTRVYVAGPIKLGNKEENTRRGIAAGEALWRAGYVVYIPHLNELWERQHPHSWEEWLAHDLEWVALCDGVLRLPGESKGANLEAQTARGLGIPVFGSVEEVLQKLPLKQSVERFVEYQREAERTGRSPGDDASLMTQELSLCGMGLAGEAGEVCDMLKKVVHHHHPLDSGKLVKELGDVLWYVAHLCSVLGVRLDDVAGCNVAKLRLRYPDGFSVADSLARCDEGKGHEPR